MQWWLKQESPFFRYGECQREVDSNGEDFYEAHCYCDIPEEYITAVYDEMYNRIDVLSLSGSFEQELE